MQVVEVPGPSVVTGQLIAGTGAAGAAKVSLIVRPLTVTFPVFATWNEYTTCCPAAVTVLGAADLSRSRLGAWFTPTVAAAGGEVTAEPLGAVPLAVAVSAMDPWSRSACVAV